MKKKDNKMQTTFFNNKLHLDEDFAAVVRMHFFFNTILNSDLHVRSIDIEQQNDRDKC